MRSKKLITLPRKIERREKRREAKALIAAKLENNIEIEIMDRIKQGVYGDKYKLKADVFEKALVDEEVEEDNTVEVEEEVKIDDKYVAADELSDIEDMFNESSDSDLGEDWTTDEDDEVDMHKKKKQKITIEYEKPKKLTTSITH